MRLLERRNAIQNLLFFIRWKLWLVILSAPGHLAFALRGWGDARAGIWRRLRLAWRLIRIHLSLRCAHSPMELLTIVEEVLRVPPSVDGVVVECGCYLGGSSAKLSLAVELAGRRLIVCDSFEGLPETSAADDLPGADPFRPGDFAVRLDLVRENVRRWGSLSVVEFVPGWFQDTLPRLNGQRIACAFLDVDLQESIRTCIEHLWKGVQPGCRVFVHDADRPPVIEPFEDATWWQRRFNTPPPSFVGARRGLGPLRRLLGFAIKAES